MSTTTEIVLALLFSSFYFIIVPALGIATGAVAGRLTPTVSTGRGALVGLASGVLAVGFGFLLLWVIYDLSRFGPSSPLGLMMFFTPPSVWRSAKPGKWLSGQTSRANDVFYPPDAGDFRPARSAPDNPHAAWQKKMTTTLS